MKELGNDKNDVTTTDNSLDRKTTFMHYSANSAALRQEIKKGFFKIEILRGTFNYPNLIDKMKLSSPFIIISLYSDPSKKKSGSEVKKDQILYKVSTILNN